MPDLDRQYLIRNLKHRARGWKAELAAWLGLGVQATLRARHLVFREFVNTCLDLGRIDLLAAYQAAHASGDEAALQMVYDEISRTRALRGCVRDLGILGRRVITNAGRDFLVDAFQNTVEIDAMHYHGSGTDNTAEAVGDTTLGTEVESRANGSQTEGGSSNIYRSIGTCAYTQTRSIVEHGLFSAASSGTLWDRTVFASIGVDNGDSIQFTYDLTVTAGG
jgi:hypothetical protein